MRFLVGNVPDASTGDTRDFLIEADLANDLTALDPSIGADLTALAALPDCREFVKSVSGDALNRDVGNITAALPIARPGETVEIEIEGTGICASPGCR